MINHYNAFISYKHAPEDNKVADAVHRGLEHFHIPGKIRKKTGMKKINRIFRDKAELPITNDLSDTISDALENSDYLIVLCSTNTKESAWVPREIECFLKNHTKRDVFTVLVNGEPQDVIPEVLQYDERVETDADGNERTVSIPIEPLSCDYRLSKSKAKKEELPRLASGIIGCAYDELMNRHRAYRMKQLTAVFSIALAIILAFSGYMFYSREQIHKTYLESLKNQSRYLANESGNLLEKEQRITALQLALEALPKDDSDDRPITAEAVKALTDATLAYEGSDGNNINAAWNYQMPNMISDFQVSNDGKILAILDSGNIIDVRNTETHESIIYIDDMDERVLGIALPADKYLVIWTAKNLYCYDTGNGSKLWEYAPTEDRFVDNELMVTDDSVYVTSEKKHYMEFALSSGEQKNDIQVPEASGSGDIGITESKLSPDKKKIVFRGLFDFDKYGYGVLDIATKSLKTAAYDGRVRDIEWVSDDTFIISGTKEIMTGSMSIGDKEIISTDKSDIRCINATDLSDRWTTEFICNGVMIESGFVPLKGDKIAYFSGNVITVYNALTGSVEYSNNVNSSVMHVSDRDGDGTPIYITENGRYATPALDADKDGSYCFPYFTDDLRQVVVNQGVYVRQALSNEIIYYGVHVYDDTWEPLDDGKTVSHISDQFYLSDDCLVFLSGLDKAVLNIYKLNDNSSSQVDLDGGNTYKYNLLGVYKDTVYLGYNNTDSYELITVGLSGGEQKKEELFKTSASFENPCTMKDNRLIYLSENNNYKSLITVYDLDDNHKTETELPDDIGFTDKAPVVFDGENIAYINGETEYTFDIGTGALTKVLTPDGWAGTSCLSDNISNGLAAVSDGREIILIDNNGEVKNTIKCPGVTPIGMSFIEGELSVLFNDGGLYRYDIDSEEFSKKADVSVYNSYDGEAHFSYDTETDTMYIQMDRLTDIVDMESGVMTTHINNCFGHHEGRDIFITIAKEADGNDKVGYYKRYTVDELIDKAHNILQNTVLPDDMKSRYGIG